MIKKGYAYQISVFYENLHYNIAKLDVHYGSYSFLFGTQQGRSKANTNVPHRHFVLVRFACNPVRNTFK